MLFSDNKANPVSSNSTENGLNTPMYPETAEDYLLGISNKDN